MKKITKQPFANGLITSRPTHFLIGKFANLLITLRPTHWLIFTLANLLIFFACSKSSDEPTNPVKTPEHLKTWEIQPVVDTTQTYMAFAVGSASATSAPVTLTNVKADESEVWVDTNNNGVFDEGTDVKVTDFSKPVSFTAANGLFTVYGAVKELTATGNALTAADVSGNKQLGKLNVANNQLNEAALQALVKSLPTATDPNAAVVLRNTDDPNEKNVVSDAVLNTAKERGWQALKTERGKEVPDLPMDTEAPKAGTITEATATAFNSALVKWTAATDNKTATEKLRYQVLYEVKGSDEVKTSEVKENILELTLTGLTEKTTYIVKVKVIDEANNATEYEAKEVTTPAAPEAPDTEAPKIGAITEFTVTELYSLNLKWTAATDNKTPLEDLRYQVFWKAEGSTEVKNSGEPKAAMFNYKIDILAQNTSYTVWVEVLDDAHNKAKYPEKTFTTDTAYIELTTNKKVGEKVELDIAADNADKAGVWLDLNNNNKWDEGIDLKPTNFNKTIKFPLQTQTFRIYGKIYYLRCNSEELTAIDIHNTVLEDLNVKNNIIPSIPSIAHLKHLKALDIDTHTLQASSVPKGLTKLFINETIPLPTIDTSPFTELILLNIQDCRNLKRLDLRNNKKLIRLYASESGLTELDLSQQPELTDLDLRDTPLTKLNIAGNKALESVIIELTRDGRGLQGTALMDFIKQLPTREEGKKGRIFLSRTQGTEEAKERAKEKHWDMIVR